MREKLQHRTRRVELPFEVQTLESETALGGRAEQLLSIFIRHEDEESQPFKDEPPNITDVLFVSRYLHSMKVSYEREPLYIQLIKIN